MIKLFVLGRDADFCQMTIDTCYRHHCAKRMQRYLFCRGGGAIIRFLPPGATCCTDGGEIWRVLRVTFHYFLRVTFHPITTGFEPNAARIKLEKQLKLRVE